jgi:hypothetical protein
MDRRQRRQTARRKFVADVAWLALALGLLGLLFYSGAVTAFADWFGQFVAESFVRGIAASAAGAK